jgi:YHS domain-containing protein
MRVLIWLLQIVAVLWLVRTLWRMVARWLGVSRESSESGEFRAGQRPRPGGPFRTASGMAPRELMKDPQCGTYVSPELSIRARFRGTELHFCSRECEQQFFQTQSEKSA